jgi:hypothetical protein
LALKFWLSKFPNKINIRIIITARYHRFLKNDYSH